MCNLLVPLCPFVLHSITASDSAATHEDPLDSSADAKILFSYLSKRPYQSPGSNPAPSYNQGPKPLSLPSLKLYKRINWHTCPCFFTSITVLHPRPGPSRPTFGCAGKYCARCSSAAKPLRPMRRGGPMDRNTRSDPYWNRCVFLGASGVFESNGSEEICETNGNYATNSARQPTRHVHGDHRDEPMRNSRREPRDRGYEQNTAESIDEEVDLQSRTGTERSTRKASGTSRYQADLNSYLKETYGK